MSSSNLLPHGRQEALNIPQSLKIVTKIYKKCHQYLRKRHLGVEEAGHPENGWSASEAPSAELTVPLKKLREPGGSMDRKTINISYFGLSLKSAIISSHQKPRVDDLQEILVHFSGTWFLEL